MVQLYGRYLLYGTSFTWFNDVGIWRMVCIWYRSMVGACSMVSMVNGIYIYGEWHVYVTALW